MTNYVPSALTPPLRIMNKRESSDASVKYVLGLVDGNVIECVYMPCAKYSSICVSSQVGCALGCTFCATGYGGFVRNLTADEISGQILAVYDDCMPTDDICEIVFKGMGEPLLNLKAVTEVVDNLSLGDKETLFSLSTVGPLAGLDRLITANRQITLQLSLHSAVDEKRWELIPSSDGISTSAVIDKVCEYGEKSSLPPHINYVLLKGVNDSEQDAEKLIELLRGKSVFLKLSRFNKVLEAPFEPSSEDTMEAFQRKCIEGGLTVHRFQSLASDVDGGCGQLRARVLVRTATGLTVLS